MNPDREACTQTPTWPTCSTLTPDVVLFVTAAFCCLAAGQRIILMMIVPMSRPAKKVATAMPTAAPLSTSSSPLMLDSLASRNAAGAAAMVASFAAMSTLLAARVASLVAMAASLVAMAASLVAMAVSLAAMAASFATMSVVLAAMSSSLVLMAASFSAKVSALAAKVSALVLMAASLVAISASLAAIAACCGPDPQVSRCLFLGWSSAISTQMYSMFSLVVSMERTWSPAVHGPELTLRVWSPELNPRKS